MENSNTNKAYAGTVQDPKVKTLVITAFFAAITYLGIQVFRIPMPAVIGTPFVHFGHIFVVMGVLLQGGKRGAISGALGLVIFDLLNGYIQDIPQVFAETVVKALIVGAIFVWLKKKAEDNRTKEYQSAVICSVIYGIFNVIIELAAGTVKMVILGSGVSAAFAGSLASIPATVINALFMIIAIAILYRPVSALYKKIA
ncbi:ECF transporter S component [Sporofaciens sp. SGI.106]|uniref:ECF transporter S component n=1 Tax=Sporofaciens sp. SGI.106 TaxID=3420568 RepID=UPI002AA03468|nr:ECF transporter S component [Lachnoclostridium sp.]